VASAAAGAEDDELAIRVRAVLDAGKAMAMTVVDLLSNGASEGIRVISEHKPAMTKDEYLILQRAFLSERSYTE
jgi:hypothetical protein